MPTDLTLLESLRSHRDEDLGIEESFTSLSFRSGRTVGVWSSPIGPRRSIGWLVCHSFGAEHWHLSATDVGVARALARSGFPVLRFHSQGYGDSEHLDVEPTVSTHLDDVIDAAAELRSSAGVERIGLVGARFGAAVSVLAAPHVDASFLALIDPMVSGRRYLRNLLRSRAIVELTGGRPATEGAADEVPAEPAGDDLDGKIDLRGVVISQQTHDDIAKIDLQRSPPRADSILLVQVSHGDAPAPATIRFADVLAETGNEVTSRVVSGPYAALFGDGHFRSTDDDVLGDILDDINADIAGSVASWAVQRSASGGSEGAA